MFKLFSKTKQITQSVKQSFEPPKDPQVIIAEIHESFDTASEKLLNDAKAILAGSYDIEKGERLKKVGFVLAKKAVEASAIIQEKQQNEELAKQIEYYQIHYPNNKFITEGKVKEICQKYGLLCSETKYYISDVPEKNLTEIENFKLNQEDMVQDKCYWYEWVRTPKFGYYRGHMIKVENSAWGYLTHGMRGTFISQPEDVSTHYEAAPLNICASVKDFDAKNMRIENGYKLELNLPDPIVLQPVKGGYLIVSKWGLEASDETLVNEINN